MDLANYLSELLAQQGEVSFPGLGNFVRERVSGYYDDREARFYPPYHRVKFNPEPAEEDDSFALYVARKKNISLASSKYFAEKYTSKLKEQAAINEIAFADLGWFGGDAAQLAFKPNDKISADPSFYGYEPLSAHKVTQVTSAPATIKTIYAEPEAPQVVPSAPAYKPTSTLPYDDDEIVVKKGFNIWMIAVMILVIAALSLFGIYKFAPSLFGQMTDQYHKLVDKRAAVVEPEAKPIERRPVVTAVPPDTLKKKPPVTGVKADSVSQKTNVAAIQPDTNVKVTPGNSVKRYELLGGAFKTETEADRAINRYKKRHIEAHIVTNVPGKLYKVTLGTYPDMAAAVEAKHNLIQKRKVTANKVVIQPFN